jgi:hypothetical protein
VSNINFRTARHQVFRELSILKGWDLKTMSTEKDQRGGGNAQTKDVEEVRGGGDAQGRDVEETRGSGDAQSKDVEETRGSGDAQSKNV